MQEFLEFIENNGVEDAEGLTIFITEFLEDPSIFFEIPESERRAVEDRLDKALSLFKEQDPNL